MTIQWTGRHVDFSGSMGRHSSMEIVPGFRVEAFGGVDSMAWEHGVFHSYFRVDRHQRLEITTKRLDFYGSVVVRRGRLVTRPPREKALSGITGYPAGDFCQTIHARQPRAERTVGTPGAY